MIALRGTPAHWPLMRLGDICDIKGGFAAPQDDRTFRGGTIPFVRMRDVGRHHFTSDLRHTDQRITQAAYEDGHYRLTPRGAILMPRSGSVGLNHRAILGVDAVIVSHLCAVIPRSPSIATAFLYRFLCTVDMRKLIKKTTGLDSLAFGDLLEVAIPLPPLAEQRRIADILDRADALRAKRRAVTTSLSTCATASFIQRFGDPIANPKGFPVAELASVIDPQRPITYGILKPGPHDPDGVRYVRVVDMKGGGIDTHKLRRTTTVISTAYRRSLLAGG